MNQDPTQQPQDPNAQIFVAAAELAAQPTPAESIGLTDGQFNVRKGIHDTENIDQGWSVEQVKTVVDETTGEQRQEVTVTKLAVDAEGNPVLDEDGEQIERAKTYWVDDLLSWQKSETEESAEVVEAEHALGRVGAPAVHTEVEVTMVETNADITVPRNNVEEVATDEEKAEKAQQDPTQTAEFKRRANDDLGTLYSELNRFANMPDNAVNSSIRNLADYAQRQQVDVQRTFEGAAVGALRDPSLAHDYYADSVRPALQKLLGSDTAALNRIDSVVSAHEATMRNGANQDPGYAKHQRELLVSSMIEQSRAVKKMISPDNPQASRQAELFLQGLAVGLSDNMSRGNVMQLVQKTLVKI